MREKGDSVVSVAVPTVAIKIQKKLKAATALEAATHAGPPFRNYGSNRNITVVANRNKIEIPMKIVKKD